MRLELQFGDGTYQFADKLAQVMELERKCERSLFALHDQLANGFGELDGGLVYIGGADIGAKEIRAVILHYLIGGEGGTVEGEAKAVTAIEAQALVEAYVFPAAPLIDSASLAFACLRGSLFGPELKKKDGVEADSPPD